MTTDDKPPTDPEPVGEPVSDGEGVGFREAGIAMQNWIRKHQPSHHSTLPSEWYAFVEAIAQDRDTTRRALADAEAERDALRERVRAFGDEVEPGDEDGSWLCEAVRLNFPELFTEDDT